MIDVANYVNELSAELAQALGEAIWAFSMVERLTYRYMKSLSSEPLHLLMADQSFNARIRIIRHLVARLANQEIEKERAMRCIGRATEMAKTRNLLAHNPWMIYIDLDTSEFKTEISKFTDESRSIDLERVRAFRDEARELASTFEYALEQLHFSKP